MGKDVCFKFTSQYLERQLTNSPVDVQQISFSWDLSMSERLSPTGDFLGSYSIKDLEYRCFKPPGQKSAKGSKYLRILHYNLVWDITEMQVKTHVKADFPNAVGPPTMQLCKQKPIAAGERRTGESRSIGLERDIMITEGDEEMPQIHEGSQGVDDVRAIPEARPPGRGREASLDLDEFLGGRSLIEDLARAHPHQRRESPEYNRQRPQLRNRSSNRYIVDDGIPIGTPPNQLRMVQLSSSSSFAGTSKQDGRRREGTYIF